ncbi:hypothetical protein ACKKBG_A36600 [Auxenochlorella protothecoides x Auxenochlorella symbiontica]
MTNPTMDRDTFALQELKRLRDEIKLWENRLLASQAEVQTLKSDLARRSQALAQAEDTIVARTNKILSLEAEVKSATTAASLAAADLAAARSEVRAANAEADRISAQLVARSGSAQTVLEGANDGNHKLQSALDAARAEVKELKASQSTMMAALTARDRKLAQQSEELSRMEGLHLRVRQLENERVVLKRDGRAAEDEVAALQKQLNLQEAGVAESKAEAARHRSEALQRTEYLRTVQLELETTRETLRATQARLLEAEGGRQSSPRKSAVLSSRSAPAPGIVGAGGDPGVPRAVHEAALAALRSEVAALQARLAEAECAARRRDTAAAAPPVASSPPPAAASPTPAAAGPGEAALSARQALLQAQGALKEGLGSLAAASPRPSPGRISMVASMAGFGPDPLAGPATVRTVPAMDAASPALRAAEQSLRKALGGVERALAVPRLDLGAVDGGGFGGTGGRAADRPGPGAAPLADAPRPEERELVEALAVARGQSAELQQQVNELRASLARARPLEGEPEQEEEEEDDASGSSPPPAAALAAIEAARARQANASAGQGSLWFGGRRGAAPGLTPDRLAEVLERLMEARARVGADPRSVHDEAARLLNAELARLGSALVEGMQDAERLRGEVGQLESAKLSARATATRLDELNALSLKVGALQLELTRVQVESAEREGVLLAELNRRGKKKRSLRSKLSKASRGLQSSLESAFERSDKKGAEGSTPKAKDVHVSSTPDPASPQLADKKTKERALLGRFGLGRR